MIGNAREFDRLQSAWRVARTACEAFRLGLARKWGESWRANTREREKLDKLREKEGKAQDAFFAWLDRYSPRSWRSGVPCYWVCEELTYADAITAGAMSVVPPPSYGSVHGDSLRFAAPVA